MATFSYPTPTANYNGGKPAIGRNVRDDLDTIRTFIVGKNLEGSNIQDDTVEEANLVSALLEKLLFTGMMIPYSASGEPSGWLICDGQEVSRATYADLNALYAADGYPYGNGDGSTTFNVPNTRNRAVVGQNDAGTPNGVDGSLTARALGDEAGDDNATIVEANVPSHSHGTPNHTHTVSDPQHDHNFGTSTVGPLANPGGVSVQGSVLNADVNLNTNVASTNITISSSGAGTTTSTSGSGDEFSVQNPSVTGNYIVKT